MAGRGRGATLPAWMTKEGAEGENGPPAGHGQMADAAQSFPGGFENDRPPAQQENFKDGGELGADEQNGDGRSDSRRRDRSDRRDRGDRRRDRDRDRKRSRRDRSRDRDRRDSRDSRSSGRRGGSDSRDGGGDRRRRKRKSNFDVKPPGLEGLPTGDAATNLLAAQAFLQQQKAAQAASTPAVPPGMQGSQNAALQQTRHARRLYVGGVQNVTEEDLKAFFTDVIGKALGPQSDGADVMSVYINLERAFAFVELRSIELTTACMALDGLRFRDLQLKIRRPSDYNPSLLPPSGPIPTLNLGALGVVSTNVPDGPNKIFVGGLPYHLQDDQVRELLQAFGPLKAFHLVRESGASGSQVREPGSTTSKGYGFCEYIDPSVTVRACEGLNGMALGDKTLTVKMATNQRQAALEKNPAVAALMAPQNVGLTVQEQLAQAMAGSNMQGGGPGLAPPAPVQSAQTAAQGALAAAIPPTKVLVLLNMVGQEELTDDNEYEDILEDIRDECGKYGQVQQVVIPRPGSTYAPSSVGKCYIQYTSETMSQAAAVALAGRQFANRVVKIEYFPEDKFALGHLE
mmetsp:Transcript_16928/g.22374  ORF Transcript_16928/g.22374 Transcript_16928/m.22374 type:complete len:572 (-) Transcript_16928:367-2082(-)|eukprot:CAMPEP_0117744578 /NCGR_PEP_ID=MMETSP0947-20121206/6842_1 /TAXON_ID=44440 /ORGANISM="Chattonella subsalsa, Strain CCMP2191" /LENGTH=571 /DNA_ID=CAMNT_0005561553 /DNA_START=49 /DNA_END=1764 /DNA_ORIENTATION=+